MTPFNPIQPLNQQIAPLQPGIGKQDKSSEVIPGFGQMFMGAVNSVQGSFDAVEDKTNALLTGRLNNIHDVVIAGEKSGIMLKLATQIASKISTACTTLFQMQL